MTSQIFQSLVTLQHLNLYLFKFSTLQHPGFGIKTTVLGMHSGLAVLSGCSESSSSKPVDRIRLDFSVVEIVPVHRRSPKEICILRFATMMYVGISVTMWRMSLFMPTPLPSATLMFDILESRRWKCTGWACEQRTWNPWGRSRRLVGCTGWACEQRFFGHFLSLTPKPDTEFSATNSLVSTSCLVGEHRKGNKHRRRGGSTSENRL